MSFEKLRGVIPPIVTPVDSHENVDKAGLKAVTDYVLDGGVHGIFVLGSNGEYYAFNYDEQKIIAETAVEHVNGRVPVFIGASAITTKECVRLAKMAEGVGADALTVLTPIFIQPNEEEMYLHYKKIAEATSLPVLLYNNPGRTSNNISVSLLKRLSQIDNIVGIKNTSLDFSRTIDYIEATKQDSNFKVFCGTDYYIYASLVHGGAGCVAGTANVAPRLVADIYDKFMAGDTAGAMAAQTALLPLRDAYELGTFPVVMKECLNMMGINAGGPIGPIGGCTDENRVKIREILKRLNLVNN